MNGNLLDTNVIIRILNGDEHLFKELSSFNNFCTSVIVLGELLYGATKSARSEQNKQNAKVFCSNFPILEVDERVSEAYGAIKKIYWHTEMLCLKMICGLRLLQLQMT